jgi:DNA-binding transcriptional MerR regulator
MISQDKYYQNFKDTYPLLEQLRSPVFLKTELDVVYNDFIRWEKNGLLWPHENFEKHEQRRYSYVEYTWLKIVEQLRAYGFSYNLIEGYLSNLSEVVGNELFIQGYNVKKEKLLEIYDKDKVEEFMQNIESINISELLGVSLLEMLIINVIPYNDIVSILFYNDIPELTFPISGEVYKEIEKDPNNSEYIYYLNKTHLSISINEIIKKFVINDLSENTKSGKFKSILSTEEHNLLKIIRKKYKNIKSIKIRFQSDEMKMIEIKTTKKARVESRLLEHIKKGEYSTIQIESVDGTIVNFENTQKYKL